MLKIVTYGNSMLNTVSEPVKDINDEIADLAVEMGVMMQKKKGVGLAAVQIGRLIRIFVTKAPDDIFRVFINPEIIETSLEQNAYEEGCLSVPGINTDIIRSTTLRIQAWNELGKPFTLTADGFFARIIQHELDHLNGMLFIDRIDDELKNRLIKLYTAQKKAS
jgi:peptide deformylase